MNQPAALEMLLGVEGGEIPQLLPAPNISACSCVPINTSSQNRAASKVFLSSANY